MKMIDDSKMRKELAKMVGLDSVPEIDPSAIDRLDGLLDDLVDDPVDSVQLLKEHRMGKMMNDLSGPKHIEVVISEDGRTIWINDEIQCLFRACRVKNLIVDDRRKR